jgi:hypothetical protein
MAISEVRRASREIPAEVSITREFINEDGVLVKQKIHSCSKHQFRTIAELRKLGPEDLSVTPADPAHHGCKGCLDGWSP